MHELGIAQELIETALAALPPGEGMRVAALYVQLGAAAGVSEAELRFGFEVMSSSSPLAGARLEIEAMPAVVYCPVCDGEFALAEATCACCPMCGTAAVQVVRGKDLTLAKIEIVNEPARDPADVFGA
ncbi:MAG TPA: hydrogenase maturation nickel metallochaperone HypA [Caldilineaceae bacterium]|nr:hydrogenase maturation nickel metallochaperone HypA [Caldilineaceae bacterium]